MVFAEIGKYVGGKVITAILFFAVVAGGYWCYTHPEQLRALGTLAKYVLIWLGLVLVLPWASFFMTGWVVRQDSNIAGGLLLFGLTLIDALVAFYLADWSVSGAVTWMVLLFGFLSAGVYNFIVCDWQAARLEDGL